jgi:hypothetical protein
MNVSLLILTDCAGVGPLGDGRGAAELVFNNV